jgi:hypothetical protein
LVQFLRHMWREWVEHDRESLTPLSCELRISRDPLIQEDLKGRDRCIKLVCNDIFSDFFHGLMQELHGSHIILGFVFVFDDSRVRLVQEATHTDDGIRIPWSGIGES